jgi:hypothetical protein
MQDVREHPWEVTNDDNRASDVLWRAFINTAK